MAEFNEILEKAKEETTKELMKEIKNLTVLSEDDILVLAPDVLDKKNLSELLKVVKDKTKSVEYKIGFIGGLSQKSDIVLKILEKFI